MKRKTCIALCSIHLLALAVCTYIAAIQIKSLLVTGIICSFTGIAMGVLAIACNKRLLAAAGFLTPAIAVILLVLEAFILQLGSTRAAFPFCVVFIVNQVIATLTILVQLNILIASASSRPQQVTLKTLIVSITSFSVFFAISKQLLNRQHDWLMALALGLLGLTFVGLTVTLYALFSKQSDIEIAP